MKTKRKLNVKLLRKIQKYITEEPRRFFMSWFIARADTQEAWERIGERDLSKERPPCGTAACIAGWANLLTDCKKGHESDVRRACEKIGIDYLSYDSGGVLFADDTWPDPFSSRYKAAKTPQQRAKIACQRIDHLIKTGE